MSNIGAALLNAQLNFLVQRELLNGDPADSIGNNVYRTESEMIYFSFLDCLHRKECALLLTLGIVYFIRNNSQSKMYQVNVSTYNGLPHNFDDSFI